jgi:hypothetical protein
VKKILFIGAVIFTAGFILAGGPHVAQPQAIHAAWDGDRFTCTAGTSIWVSEDEARAGNDNFVYCVSEYNSVK